MNRAIHWFQENNWKPFPFQVEAWNKYLLGYSGLINAPTGSGKTYSLLLPSLLSYLSHPTPGKLHLIWVTPIRALSKEIYLSSSRASIALGADWKISIRHGDTTSTERSAIWDEPPQMLITTPESLHVMMCDQRYESFFSTADAVVVDEWHELLGSKRGVQIELFLSRIRGMKPDIKVWGISATIGNMDEAMNVLLGIKKPAKYALIKSDIKKEIIIQTLLPDEIENYPWAGHIGLKMTSKILPIIHQSKSTLIFTNTRAQSEIWYRQLLEADPSLAGVMAMHHGSISREMRDWVEDALYDGRLKAVVCTSSLDLGVDFRPVDSIVQIGSPKGVARFIQRAGRSGHRPGEVSRIYFVPTHTLELVEAAALREAVKNQNLEERIPYIRSFDVLIQYLMTLSVSGGFSADQIFREINTTFSYHSVSREEWEEILSYLVFGSHSLASYDEYKKIALYRGKYRVVNQAIARRHKLSIGTIVSDGMLKVQYVSGKKLGQVEEWFLAQLMPGDVFWFAGQALELVRIKEMTAQVRKSTQKNGKIPSYMGGRMPLSSEMSKVLRLKLQQYKDNLITDIEISQLIPLFKIQEERSYLPGNRDLLIEYFHTKEGYHLLIYPFEGRQVHEGMGALLAQRISAMMPIGFSIAMNDYGFELLSDKDMDIESVITPDLFSTINLQLDIQASINAVELARRRFRDISRISGLLFQGFPGNQKKERHLQSSAQLLFNVFHEYESGNLLYLQTYDEVMTFQLEESRLRKALYRIQQQNIMIVRPKRVSPLAFPIMVDRLRDKMSSEKLEDRIEKMKVQLLK